MLKFIHLTDTHIIGGGRLLYGSAPAAQLRAAVNSINAEHGDAAFVIHTGDLTHWGDAEAYDAFAAEIARLAMPIKLMAGNHDAGTAFRAAFPDQPVDENGFAQQVFDTAEGRFVLLDTRADGRHSGHLCAARLDWLGRAMEGAGDLFLFMHHPPFAVGIEAMDQIMLEDAEAFHDVIAPHKPRIRHLFFGHLHRAVFGNWRGVSWSCMRGTNHQVGLDLDGREPGIAGNLVPAAYGVALADKDRVVVHMHDFADLSPTFTLKAPEGDDHAAHALNIRHKYK